MKIKLEGEIFELLPERAVYWEAERALLCSDLHWGRESFLQKFGMAIPSHSFALESKIITSLIERTGARELWILGDFIHHPEGLHPELAAELTHWLEMLKTSLSVTVRFIPGNHDRKFELWASQLPIVIEANGIRKKNFLFLHEPRSALGSREFTWFGHLHPAIRIPKLLGNSKLPCFLIQKNSAFLPAFSRMAGGAAVELNDQDSIFAIAEKQVLSLTDPQKRELKFHS